MRYYCQHNTPGGVDDFVDERWDGNLGFYSSHHDHSIKERQPESLESLFQNLNLSKEVSPPLTEKSNNNKGLNTSSFREDIEQVKDEYEDKDYFQEFNSPVIVVDMATPLTTPPTSVLEEEEEGNCDYLTTNAAIHDNHPPRRRNLEEEEEDFSIIPVSELSPIESINLLDEEEPEQLPKKTDEPVNFDNYHSDLVQHYKDIVLRMTDPHTVSPQVKQVLEPTLPDMYKKYISDIRKSLSVSFPCTL